MDTVLGIKEKIRSLYKNALKLRTKQSKWRAKEGEKAFPGDENKKKPEGTKFWKGLRRWNYRTLLNQKEGVIYIVVCLVFFWGSPINIISKE